MRSTKVKALSVGGRRKIYYSGDTVTEEMFPKGEFDKLIERGYLHPVGDTPDDGKKPVFESDDDQPETAFGADVKLAPQPQLPGMVNPMFAPQPPVQSGPSEPKKPTEPPVVPGTPGDESVKVQNDVVGKEKTDLDLIDIKKDAEKSQDADTTKVDTEAGKEPESGITVAQLKKDLDARGTKYPANAKKEDLLKLWASGE